MKIKITLFICLVFNIGYIASAQTYCDFIKEVREYQNSVKLNQHFEEEFRIPEVDTTSFDINIYMNMFNKLVLNSGKEFLLINNYSPDAGSPSLCVKDIAFNEDKFIVEIITKQNKRIDSIVSQNKSKYVSENHPEEIKKKCIPVIMP